MVLIFVEGPDALTVHHEALEGFLCPTVNAVYRLVPNPKALRAGVDRGAHAKPTVFRLL